MRESRIVLPPNAGVAELADALDSKSSDRKVVWVRAPPPASPLKRFFPRESPISSVKIRMRNDAHGNTKSEGYLSTIRQQMETLSAQWAPKPRPSDCI